MDHNTHNEDGKRMNNVHVNPNFANKPHINRNFPFPNTGLHINPNFVIGNDVLKALFKSATNASPDYDLENQIKPKIYFNPKLLTFSQQSMVHELNSEVQPSKYVVHSKNKIIKRPASLIFSAGVSTGANTVPTVDCSLLENNKPSVIKSIPKKPSYSYVRRVDSQIILKDMRNELSFKQFGDADAKTIPQNSLSNRVWRPKSNISLKNRYKVCNNIVVQKRKSLLPSDKYKVCNNNRNPALVLASTPSFKSMHNVTRSLLSNGTPQFVFIRGEKYIVNNKVLRKVSQNPTSDQTLIKSKDIKKVTVSGVTYIRKSSNTFVTDNRRENSLKKRRKLNVTCPIYRRLGVCIKHNLGKCPLVHNPKNISICTKFLKGICKIDDCHLSHEVVLGKMPTCKFFLDGCCVRDPCPYLHVKVNDSAKVCLSFLQGYCTDAEKCKNIHICICPDFYKFSQCKKLKCPYPHRKIERKGPTMPSNIMLNYASVCKNVEPQIVNCANSINEQKSVRYFLENCEEKSTLMHADLIENNKEPDENVAYRGRPKLGHLPSYIALE